MLDPNSGSGQLGMEMNPQGTHGAGTGTKKSTKETQALGSIQVPRVGAWDEADNAGLSRDAHLSEDEIVPKM